MKLVSIKAHNFKGLKLIEVNPGDGTTIIGGKNRAGKSSFLDAIAVTLGGAKLCPKKPIRDGENEAACEIKIDGDPSRLLPACKIIRSWRRRENGTIASELEIFTADGHRAPSPQTILDDVIGPLGFDPERFLRMPPKEQAEILKGLVGLDFTDLDKERVKVYAKRTEINRSGKALKSRYDAMPHYKDAPTVEVSVSDLMTELQRRQHVNQHNQDVRQELASLKAKDSALAEQTARAVADVKDLECKLSVAKAHVETCETARATATGDCNVKSVEVNGLKDADEQDIQDQVAASEETNRQIRANNDRETLAIDLETKRTQSSTLTDRLKGIDATKQTQCEAAKWPVEGLGYDNDGVTLMERPLDQASATEQRKTAFGIVTALNPSLNFAMIKDGGLLDDESLADFARIANEEGFQLFVERVGYGEECTILISEGEEISRVEALKQEQNK